MGEFSRITWTTHTFSPWVGCTKVSAGCANCYAEAYDKRFGGGVDLLDGKKKLRWGVGAPRTRTSEAYWRQPLKWNRMAGELGERHRVFCSSLADVFDSDGVEVSWLSDLARLIKQTPSLDWLLLTKRPENFWRWKAATAQNASDPIRWPENVWLGVTVENQEQANKRIPVLLQGAAPVRFLSCEPLLEAVDLRRWLRFERPGDGRGMGGGLSTGRPAIDWVIIGGESGPKARPFHLAWARDLVRQCHAASAAPFVKQLGAKPMQSQDAALASAGIYPDDCGARGRKEELLRLVDRSGGDWNEWPADLRVRALPEVSPR